MINTLLANFYERDLRKLITEINLFENEANLWKTQGSVKNSAGNIALHIIGNLNHFVGAMLGKSGYIRHRDLEFSSKEIPRSIILADLESLIPMIKKTVDAADLEIEFPLKYDDAPRSNGYLLVHLLAHLNYHLGQVNYLRRVLES